MTFFKKRKVDKIMKTKKEIMALAWKARAAISAAPEPAQAEQPYTQYPYEAAISWSGFNVFGNVASINAVKTAIYEAGIVPELRERVKQAEQPRNEPVQQEPMRGMSAMNRTIAYCAASKLRSIGYEWDGSDWAAPQARNEAKTK